MRAAPLPSAEYLRSVFRYDPETGVLRWRHRSHKGPQWNGQFSGREIAHVCPTGGYIRVRLDGKSYVAHRIVFKIQTGRDPAEAIDHIDGDRTNNRWRNLREATLSENNRNGRTRRKGLKGAFMHSSRTCWTSEIRAHGRAHDLGVFPTEELAHAAYCAAAKQLHGVFANTGEATR